MIGYNHATTISDVKRESGGVQGACGLPDADAEATNGRDLLGARGAPEFLEAKRMG